MPPPRQEIEVKLPVSDLEALRKRVADAGARPRSAEHEESNVLYDDLDHRLSSSGCTVRLRRAAGRTTLTYKGAARFETGAKVREEREVEVSDGGEAEAILAGLGLTPRFRYDKRRQEWDLEGAVVALDRTPIGEFVEVEGDPATIRRVLSLLGLDASEASPYSYAELYTRRRKEDPSLPPDMVWSRSQVPSPKAQDEDPRRGT